MERLNQDIFRKRKCLDRIVSKVKQRNQSFFEAEVSIMHLLAGNYLLIKNIALLKKDYKQITELVRNRFAPLEVPTINLMLLLVGASAV